MTAIDPASIRQTPGSDVAAWAAARPADRTPLRDRLTAWLRPNQAPARAGRHRANRAANRDLQIHHPDHVAYTEHGVGVHIDAHTVTVAPPSAIPAWIRARNAGPDTYISAPDPLEVTGRLNPAALPDPHTGFIGGPPPLRELEEWVANLPHPANRPADTTEEKP